MSVLVCHFGSVGQELLVASVNVDRQGKHERCGGKVLTPGLHVHGIVRYFPLRLPIQWTAVTVIDVETVQFQEMQTAALGNSTRAPTSIRRSATAITTHRRPFQTLAASLSCGELSSSTGVQFPLVASHGWLGPCCHPSCKSASYVRRRHPRSSSTFGVRGGGAEAPPACPGQVSLSLRRYHVPAPGSPAPVTHPTCSSLPAHPSCPDASENPDIPFQMDPY